MDLCRLGRLGLLKLHLNIENTFLFVFKVTLFLDKLLLIRYFYFVDLDQFGLSQIENSYAVYTTRNTMSQPKTSTLQKD